MAEPTQACAASPTPRNGMSRQLNIMQLCLWGTETKEGLSDLAFHMFIPIFQCSPSHFSYEVKSGVFPHSDFGGVTKFGKSQFCEFWCGLMVFLPSSSLSSLSSIPRSFHHPNPGNCIDQCQPRMKILGVSPSKLVHPPISWGLWILCYYNMIPIKNPLENITGWKLEFFSEQCHWLGRAAHRASGWRKR